MSFAEVPSNVDWVEQEHNILRKWKESRAFETLREIHKGEPPWSFIDGPITANNPMGAHHGWGRTYKDLFNRYWTMRGRELRYQNGFDCQGLWVEVEVEKDLGFQSKKDILEYGLAKFVLKCKERVLRFAAVQTEQSIRLGYWMDWNDPDRLRWLADLLIEDPTQEITVDGPRGPVTDTVEQIVGRLGLPELGGSYFTLSNENNIMIWTFLKRCWERGWIYRGVDVMPWCPRCSTGISQHEIVTDGYAELTHPSVTVRFPLRGRQNEYLLAWTTTPWTLTSNVAAAVGPDLIYAKVRNDGQILYVSKGTLSMLRGDYEVLAELKGTDMVGWAYDGPFDDLPPAHTPGGHTPLAEQGRSVAEAGTPSAVESHRVIPWEEVGEEEGTGIVHIAPGCGAEDFGLGKEHGLPFIAPLDEEGYFVKGFGWLSGMHVSEVAGPIFQDLERKGLLYRVRDYTHRYPICWRCKTELVFRLVDEWYISMDELRHQIMDVTRQIRWIPSFGLERELDWLRNMHDWMISKKRFWGLALPFWVCDECDKYVVIGDIEELRRKAVDGIEVLDRHTPHRPHVDAVTLQCPHCGGTMHRVPDVGNPWLDAGIVSFSTLRYRSDREYWKTWYPAHWISESFPGQFRNWFYSMLVMGTVLDNSPSFLENFSYATLLAEDGSPMHKSSGNMIEFNEAADRMGVDVMRWLYCAHKPENNLLFGYHRADEVRRQFLIPLWNVYNFFVTYAKLDGWEPSPDEFEPAVPEGDSRSLLLGDAVNPLDRWIVARVDAVAARCTTALENSDAYASTMALEALLDDLTNWYVRRSRRRFWKSEQDADKGAAYATLYYVLVRMIRLLAPFVPFVTEAMYQNLVRAVQPEARESVHHTAWPQGEEPKDDAALVMQMELTRRVASLGLSARNSINVKVRQPLSRALIHLSGGEDAPSEGVQLTDALLGIIADELNVHKIEFVDHQASLVTYRLVADGRQLGPRFGKQFPAVRAALEALSADADRAVDAAQRLAAGLPITVEIEEQQVELSSDEVIVDSDPVEGLAVAADRGVTVAIDAVITTDLRREGMVRDLVRYIQNLRRDADLDLDDRIVVGLFGLDDDAQAAVAQFEEYMTQETLCVELLMADDGKPWRARAEEKLAGQTVKVAIRL